MSAGDVWRVLRANAWLIALAFVLSAIVGFLINMWLAKNYSRFTATGWVTIAEKKVRNLNDPNGEAYEIDISTLGVDQRTQAQILHTDALLNAVLQRPAVRDTGWFKQFVSTSAGGNQGPDMAAAKADLYDKLSIVPLVETKLIQVSFSYSNPEDCKTIIEELVDEHLQEQNALKSATLLVRKQDLSLTKSTLTLKNNRLKETIATLQSELNKEGISPMNPGASPRMMELAGLSGQRQQEQSDYGRAKSELDQLQARLDRGDDIAEIEEEIGRDPRIQSLRVDVDQLSMAVDQPGLGPNSPRVQGMQRQLMNTQKNLSDLEGERRMSLKSAYRERLEQSKNAAEANLQAVNEKINTIKDAQGELDYKMFEFFRNKQEQEATAVQLDNIDKQINSIDNDTRGKDLAAVSWAQHPERPDIPSFPKLPWTLSAAIGIGLLLSLGIAFARELMDQSVRSPRDITRVGQMNLLGMIPHEDDDPQVQGVPLPMVIFQAPTSVIAEQFRQVRTRLQQASSLDTTRSILVTSPGPGDGKSVVASNLAAGLALNGRRILLVDANFRRPQLHKIFNVGNDLGFSSALAAPENFETAVHQTNVPNLDVLPTGPKPANPTELMESQLLIDFIEKALEEYDHVIFDSGPLLFVSETVALAPRVDGVVTVVRARANSRGLLQRMRDGLRQLKAEHLGIILNAVRSQGGGYYGRNIKTYYEYQNGHAH
jgi:capsular exopolysaccharide synthesis family protein